MLDRIALQRLYRYGYSLTRNEDAGCDLLQDALEAGMRQAPTKGDATLEYVQRIMRNKFIDNYRHDRRYPILSRDQGDCELVSIDERSLEDLVIAEADVETLMAGLDPLERELLFLWAVEGYTAREISERTATPRGTVLSRIHRLRQKIIAQGASAGVSSGGGAGW